VFTGPADPYGRIGKGSERFVHRLGWKQLRGPIPDGMELHHRCGVHACWNPDHLQLVTHAENLAYRRKAHCKRGHPLSGANFQVPTYGSTQGLARGAAVSAMPNDSERFASARRRTSDDCGATEHRR
jgi:HNH endonuclease